MKRFFDPDKTGQLRQEWRKPLLLVLVLIGLGWAGYYGYVNVNPRNVVTAYVHIVLLLLSAPVAMVVVMMVEIALAQRNNRYLAESQAAARARQRSRRLGATGTLLWLAGIGVGLLANSSVGDDPANHFKTGLMAGIFLVPGILAMFYARTIDDKLSNVPQGLCAEALEQWIDEKTSVGGFARKVLLFVGFTAAVGGIFWFYPDVMETNQNIITGLIVAIVFGWVVWTMRRDKTQAALMSPVRAHPPELARRAADMGQIDAVTVWQYGLFAAGVIWALAARDFIAPGTAPPLRYVPLAGLVVGMVGGLTLRIITDMRR